MVQVDLMMMMMNFVGFPLVDHRWVVWTFLEICIRLVEANVVFPLEIWLAMVAMVEEGVVVVVVEVLALILMDLMIRLTLVACWHAVVIIFAHLDRLVAVNVVDQPSLDHQIVQGWVEDFPSASAMVFLMEVGMDTVIVAMIR